MTPSDKEDLTDHDLLIRIDERLRVLESRPHGVRLWAQVGGIIVALQVLLAAVAKMLANAASTLAGSKGP